MKKLIVICLLHLCSNCLFGQSLPCSNPQNRQFDFWLGQWDVYGIKGAIAGYSKISLILDSCVILEEWTSAGAQQGLIFSGKSFNSYNAATKQWQQTWTDNTGQTTEYLRGEAGNGKIIFYADKVTNANGKPFMRRLTFTQLSADKVRQLGERSNDACVNWVIEYDLEYRRKQ